MTEHQKIQALIIKKNDLAETDAIYTVISQELGLIRLKARGVKKISSKNAPHLQSLNFSQIEIVRGKTDLWVITSSQTIEPFKNIKRNFTKIVFTQLLLEHYLCLVDEDIDSQNFNYFFLTLKFIDALDNLDEDWMNLIYMWLMIKILNFSGRKPELYVCSKCGSKIQKNSKVSFDPKYGGIICEKCQKNVKIGFVVDNYTIKLFRLLGNLEIQDLKRITRIENSQKIFQILNKYIKYYLESPIKSEKFFNDLISEKQKI